MALLPRRFADRLVRTSGALAALGLLAGCEAESPPLPEEPEHVLVRRVTYDQVDRELTLTGTVVAKVEASLAFQTAGRVDKRYVDVSSRVRAGDLLATIDQTQQRADLESAEAGLRASAVTLREAEANFDRQARLLESGVTTRSNYDAVREQLGNAQGAFDTAQAEVDNAREQLSFTELRADADGVITERNTETGQVAAAAQPVFTLAHDGPREAVFNVYEALLLGAPPQSDVEVRLVSDPSARAKARISRISPTLDLRTGTVEVRATIVDAAPEMGLGSAVEGVGRSRMRKVVDLPWSSLTSVREGAAVWVMDPATRTVSLRPVEIADYRSGRILVADGLADGDQVVIAGANFLREGQLVDPAEDVAR
ncbi:efflux RND transporter periplasmic adaptor subunit [Antarcticirhabdus aurantiaca]|uniref:Efflux RND transporter periplasmic adaptor subunit n=1 Tax=Antarcticirhabdus aurantiaca TaxID=2606717 RepID=A0ACD4NNF3_9HYPH|nr:efflux RND transporter periplasmic adaptor subunit [Antarcticirhabdus aurantiaca]WAJ28389.1 efflux RND transporter periplasmic adaptor subunit [Jeongeuplla avenae]